MVRMSVLVARRDRGESRGTGVLRRIQMMAARPQTRWQAMAELVADLENLGYLIRQPDPSDRRKRLICLTAKGRLLTLIAISAMRELEDEWARRVGQGALDELRLTLQRLSSRD